MAAAKLLGSDAEICWLIRLIVDWAAAEIAAGTGPVPKASEPEARALASGCNATGTVLRAVQRCRFAVTEFALQHLRGEVLRLIARGIPEPAIV